MSRLHDLDRHGLRDLNGDGIAEGHLCEAVGAAVAQLDPEDDDAVLRERARTMSSVVEPNRLMLVRYYESAGRHEDAQVIVQEILSAYPEITVERGVEALARFSNEEWIPEDPEALSRATMRGLHGCSREAR